MTYIPVCYIISPKGGYMAKGVPRDQSTQHKVLHRLKIARGHLDRVIKMVQDNDYCIDIIHQSQAVQSALSKSDRVMIANHLRTCVVDEINRGNSSEVISEVMKVMNKQIKINI